MTEYLGFITDYTGQQCILLFQVLRLYFSHAKVENHIKNFHQVPFCHRSHACIVGR